MNRARKERERDDHSQKNEEEKEEEENHHFIGNSDFSCRALFAMLRFFYFCNCVCAHERERERARVWLSRCSIRSSFWSPRPKMKTDYNDSDARTYARTKENSIKISRFDVKFIMRSIINRWLKMVIDKAFAKDVPVTPKPPQSCCSMNIGCVRASAHRATTTHFISSSSIQSTLNFGF